LDTTFEFEKKRNAPVRYDRELYVKTIKAMGKIEDIKTTRKEKFYLKRRLSQREKLKSLAENELEKNKDFLANREELINTMQNSEEEKNTTAMHHVERIKEQNL